MAALLKIDDKLIINLDFIKTIKYDAGGRDVEPLLCFIDPRMPEHIDIRGEAAERTWKWLREHTDGPAAPEAADDNQTQADEGTNRFASALDTSAIDDAS